MSDSEKIKILEQENEALKKRLDLYENDPSKAGYFVLVNIQNQQVEYLRSFKIKDEIAKTTKEDASYMRAKDLWENLPKMIGEVSDLKSRLKINPDDEKKELQKNQITTPESMAGVIK